MHPSDYPTLCEIRNNTQSDMHLHLEMTPEEVVLGPVLGKVQPFHVVLGGIQVAAVQLPELGVLFDISGLTIDYRMGPEWSVLHISEFARLMRKFKNLGATISTPWWGSSAEHLFEEAINTV